MTLTETERTNAIDWIADCGFYEDLLEHFDVVSARAITDHQLHRLVARNFDGGWCAFLSAYCIEDKN